MALKQIPSVINCCMRSLVCLWEVSSGQTIVLPELGQYWQTTLFCQNFIQKILLFTKLSMVSNPLPLSFWVVFIPQTNIVKTWWFPLIKKLPSQNISLSRIAKLIFETGSGRDIYKTKCDFETDQFIFILSHRGLKSAKFAPSSTNWPKRGPDSS